MANVVTRTNLPLRIFRKGKVRNSYYFDKTYILIIATDRISAFDVIMDEGIEGKGRCLTGMSRNWFESALLKEIVPNHFVTSDSSFLSDEVRISIEEAGLEASWMIVEKHTVIPIECIVRGFMFGSGWDDYQKDGKVCGLELPSGMVEAQEFDVPIFTPSTKAELGMHDENIDFTKMISILDSWLRQEMPKVQLTGTELAAKLRSTSRLIYSRARTYARTKGIIICDTKFEFGLTGEGDLVLIDEVLTPDSSRFWPEDKYEPGRSQPSFDKQFVRDYLLSIEPKWNKKPPPPPLPKEIREKTAALYQEIHNILVG